MTNISDIIDAVGGEESRDGESVVISMGRDGYIRLTPTDRGVVVDAHIRRRQGYHRSEYKSRLSAAGIEPAFS